MNVPAISFAATALAVGTGTALVAKEQHKSNFAWTVGGLGAATAFFTAGPALEGESFLGPAVCGAGVGAMFGAAIGASLSGD